MSSYDRPVSTQSKIELAFEQVRAKVDATLQWFVNRVYIPLLKRLLYFRYITLSIFAMILLVTVALVSSGRIQSVMDAPVNDYYLFAILQFVPGTPFEEVNDYVFRLERAANDIRMELNTELGLGATDRLQDSFQHIISVSEDNAAFVDIEIAIVRRHFGEGLFSYRAQWVQERKQLALLALHELRRFASSSPHRHRAKV